MYPTADEMVAAVKAAYEKTGRKPCQGRYIPDAERCCPLGALFLAEGQQVTDISVWRWAEVKFSHLWIMGFIDGVDGRADGPSYSPEKEGYEVGKAVCEAVWPKRYTW